MNQFFTLIANILRRYSPGQRAVVIVIFLGLLSSIISLLLWASRPEYDMLYGDLDSSAASRIVSELRAAKVKYKLEDGGKTILVPSDDVAELRLKFAEAGYVGEQVSGYEIFDDARIGMTSFMQQLNMRRALEGELTKTINQFPGVANSRVHLVLPEGRLFEDEKKGSASVVLHFQPGRYLSDDQVRGIAALVSNSAEGIDPENVVVVDSEGNLLSENRGADRILGSAGNQWDLRHTIEAKLQNKVMGIVEGIVGYQNAVVEVSTDINFEQVERTKEAYDPENVVVVSEERQTESSANSDTSQNVAENYEKENVITNYELNKTVEHFVSNTGTINRLSVAVLVNGTYRTTQGENGEQVKEYIPRSKKDLGEIAALVRSAVGYNEERGDIVEVRNLQFDKSAVESDREYFLEADKRAMWAGIIHKGLIGLGILVAFFLVRALLKNTGVVLQLPASRSAPALGEGFTRAVPLVEQEEIPEDIYIKKLSPEARAKLKAKDRMTNDVVTYSKENPEDAARLIRSWLTQLTR